MANHKIHQSAQRRVLTVGHSTRPIEEFVGLLTAHAVTCLVDVRTVPRSRHNPQFNRETLATSLELVHIRYIHMPGLGGFRHPSPQSPNAGWHNASFRGYADYMQTTDFAGNLSDLIDLAVGEQIAIMCAEAVPWRCHRSLIADALTVRGMRVEEIVSRTQREAHALTAFAKVEGTLITYPPPSLDLWQGS